ncbi:GyrI-like domain-containing protein [Corynebacterium suedekumii]|uniref:GyrI-like domain-containing protein n=1 Tax=Corynebacterium suedekumii TaxID=3049801 RepID=A0ABY8VLQ8_9CORY|nr:GyrI-like domain-containing protein [Corynebacterium suedekumii]WIM69921.1 GyrI-like domain-containing protein [Corynebacterium suedekumii]
MSDYRTVTVPAHHVLASRETISADAMVDYFDRAFTQAARTLAAAGLRPTGAARAYYFSPPTDTVDLAGGFVVPGDGLDAVTRAIDPASGLAVHLIPESRAMVTSHHGGYDGLPQAWQELVDHAHAQGEELSAPCWEEYVTMPTPEADPADMVTDLYQPLV